MPANQQMIDAALEYAKRGWRVLPVKPRGKTPLTAHGVKDATCATDTIKGWFRQWPDMNIGIACGRQSGLVVVDVDGPAGQSQLEKLFDTCHIPLTAVSKTGNGFHVFFRYPEGVSIGNRVRFAEGLDARSDGGYVIAPPSVHPYGATYAWLHKPEISPPTVLPEALIELIARHKSAPAASAQAKPERVSSTGVRDADTLTIRASAYLAEIEPAVQGMGGHNALLRAAGAMVVGFDLDDGTALSLLWSEFNPRCVPPWDRSSPSDVKDFERKVKEAREHPLHPFGYLRDADGLSGAAIEIETGAEIAGDLIASAGGELVEEKEAEPERPEVCKKKSCVESDLPDSVFFPPGFIGEFVRYTVGHAPYPHIGSAFAAALSTLSLLAGRKYKTASGSRPNLYVCALGESGSGKECAKGVIDKLAVKAGFTHMVGNRFASGEGVEDALGETPSFLFKVDEFDTLLRPLGKGGETLTENMRGILLSIYGESGGVHICRAKAGQLAGERKTVVSPNLVLFCTAIPAPFYDALSERVVTSGLLSRFLTLDVKRPRVAQNAVEEDLPESLVEIAKRLVAFCPVGDGKQGNIDTALNPVPVVVPMTGDAERLMNEFREECDNKAQKAIESGDNVMNAIVVRSWEKSCKLALLYAVSENYENPEIGEKAARWAIRVERFCSGRLLDMFGRYGSTSDFEKKCRLIVAALEKAKSRCMKRSDLLNSMRQFSAKDLEEALRTLFERGTVIVNQQPTKGRTSTVYSLPPKKTA